jgi:integrase
MPKIKHRLPVSRLHKPSGRARVRIDGHDIWLGRYGSPEAEAAYHRLIAEWLASGRRPPDPHREGKAPSRSPTVAEVILAYWQFVQGYYVKHGRPTSEPKNIQLALRPVRQLYGATLARDFGPLALKAVRQKLIETGICRNEVNKRVGRIVRMFKWAVAEELVEPAVHQSLKAVPGLRQGRSEARESEPVKPVPDADVDAVRPFVSRQVWAMIEVQRLSGMRPGEVTIMRTGDIDRSGEVWEYVPATHKTEHHGRRRIVFLGPRAQAILSGWLRADPDAYLFSPVEALAERSAERRAARKTPMTPSQAARRPNARRKRPPRSHYSVISYSHAIRDACIKAGVPHWHPHQLRHNAATRLRKEYGLEGAQTTLGHRHARTSELYAERDEAKAREIMREVG